MGRNVEIKARVAGFDALRKRVESIADRGPQLIHQEDTFFSCPEGRLKLRRLSEAEGELIFYQRADSSQPRESCYLISPTADPVGLADLLVNALGVRGTVRKKRTLYWCGQTRIHLDEVEELGTFVELEVVLETDQLPSHGLSVARRLMKSLEIEESNLVQEAYIDLIEKKR